MTDDDPSIRRGPGGPPGWDDDETDESDTRPTGILRALLDLLAKMDERGERRRRGRWSGGRTRVDYSVSIGGLGDSPETDPFDSPGFDDRGFDDRDGHGFGDQERHALTTRELEDGLLLAADLTDVHPADVSVDLDDASRAVTITVEGDVLGRIPLDDGDWTVVDVSVNNDVLAVKLSNE